MKQLFIYSAISLIILAGAISVYADLAPPPKPKPVNGKVIMNTGLEVIPDAKAYDARLQIPRARLGELRAALANEGRDESATLGIANNPTRTIIAGLFLFMSLSFGGVWLARSGQTRIQKIVAAVMLGTAVIAATAIITQGNVAPPQGYVWRNLPQNLNAGRPTNGPLKIEIVEEDDVIRLIVPLRAVDRSNKKAGEE
jgi:hypothetical protein